MYLRKLHIRNFRCIADLKLRFKPGVNVLIGENNTGKTTVLDALRLGLSIGDPQRDLYVRERDFRSGEDTKPLPIGLDFIFDNVTEDERGVFYELLAAGKESEDPHLELHVEYALEERLGALRPVMRYWGGETKGASIPPEVMSRFYHVHFDALRDASRDLRPSRGNRLGQLLEKLVPDREKQQSYADRLNRLVEGDPDWQNLVGKARRSVNEHLSKTTLAGDPVRVDLGFVSRKFGGFAESLKMVIPVFGTIRADAAPRDLRPETLARYFDRLEKDYLRFKSTFLDDLEGETDKKMQSKLLDLFRKQSEKLEVEQNGLGCNNLIYFATVLGDIQKRKRDEKETYVALLVEEPEAHLHPQRQSVLFARFREWEKDDIQSFITSHSPTVTSKSELDSVIVLRNDGGEIKAVPLRKTPLDSDDKKHLQKFLDVTKSQLFFSRGVMLVEGISEALLMPAFAKITNPEYDLEKNGIEVVNVGGLAFRPFASLFREQEGKKHLPMRCAIVTDDDRNNGEESDHAKKASELAGDTVRVFKARRNLEFELYKANPELMSELYYRKGMHPKTDSPAGGTRDKQARAFVENVVKNRDKGDFALRLAERLDLDPSAAGKFVVPDYIKHAVTWLLTGNDASF
jgi:putative ATP-dependent endonuclease of OLD family